MADVAEARPSATVVLVRESQGIPEIFMVKRHARSSFGAAYAFPGGVLEQQDGGLRDCCRGVSATEANELLGTEDGLEYFVAAIRELFEETGVLLADCETAQVDMLNARQALNDGTLGWQDFVRGSNLVLDCGQLDYFSYWITPDTLPKRYATRFFLAELPHGQQATHCGGELTDSAWISAKDVLAASRANKMSLHFPTTNTVKNLAQFTSIADMRDWCAARQREGVPCIYPAIVDGGPVLR